MLSSGWGQRLMGEGCPLSWRRLWDGYSPGELRTAVPRRGLREWGERVVFWAKLRADMLEGILCEGRLKARVAKIVRSRGLSLQKGSQHFVSLFFFFLLR